MSNEKINKEENGKEDCLKQLYDRSLSKPLQNVDDLYSRLGDPGKLQLIWYFFLAINIMIVSSNAVVGVFFGYTPHHYCNATIDGWSMVTNTTGSEHNFTRGTDSQIIDFRSLVDQTGGAVVYSVPGVKADLNSTTTEQPLVYQKIDPRIGQVKFQRSECSVNLTFFGDPGDPSVRNISSSQQCNGGEWVYDLSGNEATTVSEFDLVCQHSYLTYMASMLYFVGFMLANVTLGYASDVFGRRPVILFALNVLVIASFGIAFANSYAMFAGLRFLLGILAQGLYCAAFVSAIELFPVHHRGKAGVIVQMFWGFGCLYLSIMAYLVQDWRYIQLALLVPAVFSAISMWYVGESLRWLLARGKTERASELVTRITKFNKLDNPIHGDDHSVLAEYKVHYVKNHGSYLSLVRTPQMRKRTICCSAIMFGINLGYFGMTYNNAELAGDRYLNSFLGSLTETIAFACMGYSVVRYGRRKPLMVCLLMGSICCLVSGVIPDSKGANNIAITFFSVFGRLSVAACFSASDMFLTELFPTVLRSMGIGLCMFIGRLGAVCAPLVTSLRQYAFTQLPPLLFATFTLLGGVAVFLLPETSGQHLPDTVDDVENNFGWQEDNTEMGVMVKADQENNDIKHTKS